jgi:hypothetical protein
MLREGGQLISPIPAPDNSQSSHVVTAGAPDYSLFPPHPRLTLLLSQNGLPLSAQRVLCVR